MLREFVNGQILWYMSFTIALQDYNINWNETAISQADGVQITFYWVELTAVYICICVTTYIKMKLKNEKVQANAKYAFMKGIGRLLLVAWTEPSRISTRQLLVASEIFCFGNKRSATWLWIRLWFKIGFILRHPVYFMRIFTRAFFQKWNRCAVWACFCVYGICLVNFQWCGGQAIFLFFFFLFVCS